MQLLSIRESKRIVTMALSAVQTSIAGTVDVGEFLMVVIAMQIAIVMIFATIKRA